MILVLQDDEYVVYSPDQVKLKYVVQYSLEGDQLKEFSPAIDTSAEPALPSSVQGKQWINAKMKNENGIVPLRVH